ncbi:RNA polymerase sigma factor [Phenylobacterium montanum]|uniref:Sigma-70 family RNA polymerase sigma factor n=1 Tax=Phenylobacterium montanum TaxID=2823693 RepID=A0A975G313_9CAUL|nr:sigma-70 family RNA polymerase sigma factor [Caulobacter sp. S6]QUD89577.1 sigma-70 family RNA polymerase sigma factor [Caulobacter sp. S6]
MTEAFENWYLREIAPFEPALRSRLRALVYSDSDVEDLLWSAYERLIETGIWRSAHRPVALVHQIARNLALDQLRRSRIVPIESASAAFFQAADDEPGPEERLDDRHALAVVIAAIEALPEQCQRVFKLRRLDGMSPAEISAHTGLSISTIEKHVAKGLRLCADRLAQIGLERKKARPWVKRTAIAKR